MIGWDSADWNFINPLLDSGQMPNLARLVEGGVMANLASLRPCLSPILWTSIATGKTADKHGIAGFVEPLPDGTGVRLSSSTSRTTKALWNILSQSGRRPVIINWYASHPAEPVNGVVVSNRFFEDLPGNPADPWPVVAGSVHPVTLGEVISGFRMHPAEVKAADLAPFIPAISSIDCRQDERPAQLARELAKTISIHSVATGAMEAEEWDFLAVYYDAIDTIGHKFMPYHPPRMADVPEPDFERYQHVMRELYIFHDRMLGRLLELAGPDTTVILLSDHGFHSDHLRPPLASAGGGEEALAAAWHRPYGVLVMRGPGLLVDERIYGATLLDIAPTVLTLMDLPIGRDMDGRPLLQAWQPPAPEISSIPGWDSRSGDDGMVRAPAQSLDPGSRAAVEQLVALGYLPAEAGEAARAAEVARDEASFNLAIVHASHGRPRESADLLDELFQRHPGHFRYGVALAKAHANLKDYARSLAILEALEQTGQRAADSDLLHVAMLFNVGQHEAALKRLAEIERTHPPSPGLFSLVGRVRAEQKMWAASAEAFERGLALDGDDPHSHVGLALASNQLGDFERGADHALRAIGLLFFYPQAHFQLGMAFKGLGDIPRAIRSLDQAVTQAPGFVDAHQELANLYEAINNVPLWLNHQRMASGLQPLQ